MNYLEGYFYNHCDDPTCDLGSFDYVCPYCERYIQDYDVWWEEDDLYFNKTPYNFTCNNCNKLLTVRWDKDEMAFLIAKQS